MLWGLGNGFEGKLQEGVVQIFGEVWEDFWINEFREEPLFLGIEKMDFSLVITPI